MRTIRWWIAAAFGIIAGVALSPFGIAAALLSGWAVFALTNVVAIIVHVWPMDANATRAHAQAEDVGRRTARFIVIIGSIASLGALAVIIVATQQASGVDAIVLAVIGLVSVVASWLFIQTDYMLHYARVWYEGDARGISFNQEEDPQYTDFAYFAVGLGMTYQAADTNVTTNMVRRIVIGQTMISYLFGAGVIATLVNLITGIG